ncbi:MAG TPA: DNA mismatch repair protein MutS [Geminicoccus sp.]|uniref:DNA mismatch repair protein MutS n=1 Tax=Geminicoccus sp. TaxID=2024832 RepID=UPI002D07B344|nr:DNA mismatch repair protein MutS [Geminicoccus sp.]HWL69738.1 DNA mismatch repair protein MutS [Geminicoccus sp.]
MKWEQTVRDGETSTPMIAQWRRLKEAHPDALLFFRMGDFYELFFADAVNAAPALEVALTRRGKDRGEEVPMCGVPVHAVETYLHRAIRKGFKVAVCEQMEDPAEARRRSGKTLVERGVVRLITPGTLTEDALLDPLQHNWLAALALERDRAALARVDLSTGRFETEALDRDGLAAALARLAPAELLAPVERLQDPLLARQLREVSDRITPIAQVRFDPGVGARILKARFGLADLAPLGELERAELGAAGALVDYLELTQKSGGFRLDRPVRIDDGALLQIDPATRRSLELLRGPDGDRAGSLLAAIDRTTSAIGARLLARRIAEPAARHELIRPRADRVAVLVEDDRLCHALRALLAGMPDPERPLARLAAGRGGPRDLRALGDAADRAGKAGALLQGGPGCLAILLPDLLGLEELAERLLTTLAEPAPLRVEDGGLLQPGVDAEYDRLVSMRDAGRSHLDGFEQRLRQETGIGNLKIRHNGMLGWYVEVPAAQEGRVPPDFIRRQGLAGAVRFTTAELQALERALGEAADGAQARACEIYQALCQEVLARAGRLRSAAAALAELDVAAGLAELARSGGWVRPELVDEPVFAIEAGRHPVVEAALKANGEPFVANDCDLAPDQRLWLLTGPNMAGKSTFLRQNALIVVLAQAGAFVPARSARIGLVDRLFSRVGAADDLARGRSTFMVEMLETSTILARATERSLVVLDEIGRGTSTWDGLSIAWAVVEHLHDKVRCRGLFATHYHELTHLAASLPRLALHRVKVQEWQGSIVFLHEIGKGVAESSYGIHVAALAGLPKPVLNRARQVLAKLERNEAKGTAARLAHDLPLLALLEEPAEDPEPPADPLRVLLESVDPDSLAPKEALDLLYRLKQAASS